MFQASSALAAGSQHQPRFRPLSKAATARAFGCDAAGHVDLDALSDRERLDYLYARALRRAPYGLRPVPPSGSERLGSGPAALTRAPYGLRPVPPSGSERLESGPAALVGRDFGRPAVQGIAAGRRAPADAR